MSLAIARVAALFFAGLLAGSALANYLLESALGDDAAFRIAYKQLVIRAFTVGLPVLGVGAIVASLALVVLRRREAVTVVCTLAALVCVAFGLGVTLAVHFPINAQVITWSPSAPPPEWRALLDRWRFANTLRTIAAILAFVLLLVPVATKQDIRGR